MKAAKKAQQTESIENDNNPEQGNFIFGRFIVDAIIAEKEGQLYRFAGNDKAVLKQLCDEINQTYSKKRIKSLFLLVFYALNYTKFAFCIIGTISKYGRAYVCFY